MPTSDGFVQEAREISGQLSAWRRDFHRHPELAFQEHRSAGIIADLLNHWGFEVRAGIAQTGLLARLSGAAKSRGVLLRVDMDALPIHEQNTTEYASVHPGVMHACGHDGHMAIGLGVGQVMHRYADYLNGDLYLLFQPAEEGGGGAARMLAEGVLEAVDVQSALGVHLWNERPVGWFGISPGPVMAGAERFEMRVRGAGGHGGMPNLTRDPIVAAAAIISGTQSLISRTVDPLDSAVLSFTHIRAGSNFNVIPDEVFLEGTIRTLDAVTRKDLVERFEHAAKHIGDAHGCRISLKVERVAPPVVNDRDSARLASDVARSISPEWNVDQKYRVMVSEDMGLFLQEVPGVFVFVGSANQESGLTAGHHTPTFDFDERALSNAVALLCSIIWEHIGTND